MLILIPDVPRLFKWIEKTLFYSGGESKKKLLDKVVRFLGSFQLNCPNFINFFSGGDLILPEVNPFKEMLPEKKAE